MEWSHHKSLLLLTVVYSASSVQTAFTGHVARGNPGRRCSRHLKARGHPSMRWSVGNFSTVGRSQEGAVYILERSHPLFLADRRETVVSPEHRRKNPPPTILAEQEGGVVRIADGEPHDPCPVAGCDGTLLFLHQ